ncbi:unnamed protein product [Withania somnifera]
MTGGCGFTTTTTNHFKNGGVGFGEDCLYGLTETYGANERFILKARQGMQHLCVEEVNVRYSITMKKLSADGVTMGEVVFRGNTVMSGYLKDQKAIEEAFRGGWFHSGDLAVKYSDGYIEVKERMKDVIISGGENISTVEVKRALYSHPAVLEAALVARPDNLWEQTPSAFVKLKDGTNVNSQEIINFCRAKLPHKIEPWTVIFQDLPKTSTGKIEKFILREKVKALSSLF